ncbi:MAG TPA: pyruvate dehydrogenase complex dihydrolipoamide acetyltransferase [Stellaceae bacterium]|nr:pyruvate dehydrogenase complex dihydrolipoamide acetyltransferase [Stellaceae bacterium]
MPIEVLMPALSPTMTEGNLAKWHKKEGEKVRAGDVLAEIETDKATMEMEAVDEGVLGRILVPEGTQGVKVNQPIAVILGEDEDAKALDVKRPAAPAAAHAPQPPPQPSPATRGREGPAQREGGGTAAASLPAGNGHAASDRIIVSPLARRLAVEAGLDLATLAGTGPHGRIVKADVEAAMGGAARPRPPAPAPRAATPAASPGAAPAQGRDQVVALSGNAPHTEVPISAMRRVIARRLSESKQTIPHYYLTVDCEIDRLLAMRAEANAAADAKISVNDFVIKAVALALRKVPEANASWSEDAILRWTSVDIAVAVALDDGLITPIIKSADTKGLAAISAEMKDLAARARAGKLKLTEFQGGTFSVSNLGMFGMKEFAAVINPPQGGILAIGVGEQRPVVKNGALAVATVMSCTLSADHRVVDGATGARWLQTFKTIIEAPALMAL